jgi:hypothetical protein
MRTGKVVGGWGGMLGAIVAGRGRGEDNAGVVWVGRRRMQA